MTRWENIHKNYFTQLSTLSFDKARELLDKDGNKMNNDYLQYLHSLVQYERAYHNFGFIIQKGNLGGIRRDKTLNQCYSDLHMSFLDEQRNNQSTNDDSKENSSIQQIIPGLLVFLNMRTSLMKLYDQISTAVKRNEHNIRLEVYLEEITPIFRADISSLNNPILQPIGQVLKYEIDCLWLLIQSYIYICDYQYLNSISNLHHMHCVLKEWSGVFESPQNNTNRFGFAGASALIFKTTTKSTLYTFYSKFHELLVAKFTLYFMDFLYEYGGAEAKASITKTSPDFTLRIAQFHRRSNVEWIVLVLHTNKETINPSQIIPNIEINGNLSAPSINDEKPYQIIYGYPHKPTTHDEVTQSILTRVLINKESLISGDKMFYSGDSNQSKTYFLQNIDPRITMVLVFASHRQERDTLITNFLTELLDSLRGCRHLSYFKNGGK